MKKISCNNYTAIFAPTYFEAKPLISQLKAYEIGDYRFCRIYCSKDSSTLVVLSGVGIKNVRRAFDKLREICVPRKIILTGLAGGLSKTAGLGDIIYFNKIQRFSLDESGGYTETGKAFNLKFEDESTNIINILKDKANVNYKRGAIATLDGFLGLAGLKRKLFDLSGATAVDMEAYELCKLSLKNEISFECYKVISDTSNEDVHVDFASFADRFGRVQFLSLLKYLVKNPRKVIPCLRFYRNLRKVRCSVFDLARFVKGAS